MKCQRHPEQTILAGARCPKCEAADKKLCPKCGSEMLLMELDAYGNETWECDCGHEEKVEDGDSDG